MREYRSFVRPRAEEWLPDIDSRGPLSITIHEDDTPRDTGLLDAAGNPIYSVNTIQPIGFNR